MIQIIAFEGLAITLTPWPVPTHIRDKLLAKVRLPRNTFIWRDSFIKDGPELTYTPTKLIVIAHSMGGATAIRWCNRHPTVVVDLLLTLDPRPLHRPYVRPKNVMHAVNFYQSFPLWGYSVQGAVNRKTKWGHTAVPGRPEVIKCLQDELDN